MLRRPKSFNKLLDIYPAGHYQGAEHAALFLWYHLRRNPHKKTASLREIKTYFRWAEWPTPPDEEIREHFAGKGSKHTYFQGRSRDSFGIYPTEMGWWNSNWGTCFDNTEPLERMEQRAKLFQRDHPIWFALGVLGSICSIIGLPLSIFL